MLFYLNWAVCRTEIIREFFVSKNCKLLDRYVYVLNNPNTYFNDTMLIWALEKQQSAC